ncbi:MAG: ABC transporter permease [Candidatus Accumulibacter phosphatis]|jgi:sulfonate transport system permease protein|uniref:ABC transporter permease n=1 Tax=Candidatus Accumulibacter contiguus TaxID=2954381 RepID=A0ABX1T6C6_9PROT|nr:ABC transporter permease [Candidatus Accumulibacter contiguus]NMQ04531.1 ABC transporter permease [Candidatus Accumulibacter contiguus]
MSLSSTAILPASGETPAGNSLRWQTLARKGQGLIVPVILLIIWESVVRLGWVSAHLLPPPSELVFTLADLGQSGAIFGHIGVSSLRVVIGFSIGAGLALIVGAAVGLSRCVEALLDPTFQAIRAIPSLAWVPLLLLWLGIDESPKITLIAIGAFFPVYLNFVAGIQNVDRKLVEVGGIYGLTGAKLITRIFLPASLPNLFTGLRSGLSLAWMFLVAAELIAATKGLGYLLTDGRETGRADLVIVAIIVLALLGKLSDSLLCWLERRLLAWRDVFDSRPS